MLTDEQIDKITDKFTGYHNQRHEPYVACIHEGKINSFAREIEKVVRDEVCEWSKQAAWSDIDLYSTECNNTMQFEDGGPKDNDAEYCQFCGRKIEVV